MATLVALAPTLTSTPVAPPLLGRGRWAIGAAIACRTIGPVDRAAWAAYARPMPIDDISTLRRRTEHTYARWRACTSQGPWTEAGDTECRRLKKELDVAAAALFAARRPSIGAGPSEPEGPTGGSRDRALTKAT